MAKLLVVSNPRSEAGSVGSSGRGVRVVCGCAQRVSMGRTAAHKKFKPEVSG